jgi:hypothetical protein
MLHNIIGKESTKKKILCIDVCTCQHVVFCELMLQLDENKHKTFIVVIRFFPFAFSLLQMHTHSLLCEKSFHEGDNFPQTHRHTLKLEKCLKLHAKMKFPIQKQKIN